MKKYITFGEYNNLYKHILFYVITKYICDYVLGDFLETKANNLIDYPRDILIQQAFNYFISFIGSIFLFFYEKKQEKKYHNNKSLFSFKKKSSKNNLELIQNNLLEGKNLSISGFFIIVYIVICMQLSKAFIIFGLKGLNYWMLEILFLALINSKLFDIPIYKHKKLGIFIIIFFCSLFKILSTVYRFIDDENKKLYVFYPGLVPIGIIIYFSIILLKAYSFCKIKWLCDTKYILPSKILILYNLLGTILCFITSIISHFYSCNKTFNNNIDDFQNLACQIKDNKDSKVLYYDNYSIYFKIFCKNILISIIIFVLKTTFCFFNKVFTIYIIKNLSPEYIICFNSIYYFITEIIDLCYFLISYLKDKDNDQNQVRDNNKNKGFKFYKFFSMLAEIFCFLGCLIYLELIELHFCKLDYNINKSIKIRATIDTNGEGLIEDENASFENYEENEKEFKESTTQELIKTVN